MKKTTVAIIAACVGAPAAGQAGAMTAPPSAIGEQASAPDPAAAGGEALIDSAHLGLLASSDGDSLTTPALDGLNSAWSDFSSPTIAPGKGEVRGAPRVDPEGSLQLVSNINWSTYNWKGVAAKRGDPRKRSATPVTAEPAKAEPARKAGPAKVNPARPAKSGPTRKYQG